MPYLKHTLVGYTGFVGGNLFASHTFDNLFNSSNINDSFKQNNGLVVYSGMPSEKFFADTHPDQDLEKAKQAFENMQRMCPEQLVLISTIDVYSTPIGIDENTPAGGEGVAPYGAHRYLLEKWTREAFPNALIVRLPALFGIGLKKNFIYDMLTLCPPMLKEEKYKELCVKSELISQYYNKDNAGFYRLTNLSYDERAILKDFFATNDFNSLAFTDSRSIFQFYDLSRLWKDIENALSASLTLVNLATEPISASELYNALFASNFTNERSKPPFYYNMRTLHCNILGGTDGYLMNKERIVDSIKLFSKTFEV